ncbi:hypothetical protein FS837_005486 [Tulasnella sp. UAMH 9824]|nr:hypothetical protein FS837_005486 [Tulasnella sp. UAMH 9824]
MNPYEKVAKLACKPNATAPKLKYVDPLIATTYSQDGAIYDVLKALAPRFKEHNANVLLKASIVFHMMIRHGDTDNLLSHAYQTGILCLRDVGKERWEGFPPPQNTVNYVRYLDSRIQAYRSLGHDPIRVQSESNRVRPDTAEGSSRDSSGSSSRRTGSTLGSKTLRALTVEDGLLRNIKTVQTAMDRLLDCKFWIGNIENELHMTAFRMLVKDLLVLFQAVNEGVINLLENFFEMSETDATTALHIYHHFCDRTAPLSLGRALEEYLNDPNFEQNRIEYKASKEFESADRKLKEERTSGRKRQDSKRFADSNVEAEEAPRVRLRLDPAKTQRATTATMTAATSAQSPQQEVEKDLIDLFDSIELDQAGTSGSHPEARPQTVLNPFASAQVPMASSFHQDARSQMVPNTFASIRIPMATGFPGASPFVGATSTSPFINAQATGLTGPSHAPSPFVNMQPQAAGVSAWRTSGTNPAQLQPPGGEFLSRFAHPPPAAPTLGQPGAAGGHQQRDAPAQMGTNPFALAQTPTTTGFAGVSPSVNAAGVSPFFHAQATGSPGAPG